MRARSRYLPAADRASGSARPGPRGRIENTAPAFLAAIARGYGIECDLQAAKDGTPMVFHDEKLDRLVAASGPIAAPHAGRASRNCATRDRTTQILTFAEFLELVAGTRAAAGRGEVRPGTAPTAFWTASPARPGPITARSR